MLLLVKDNFCMHSKCLIHDCVDVLGYPVLDVAKAEFTSSSSAEPCSAAHARPLSVGCVTWCSAATDGAPWLQMDLVHLYHVTSLSNKGHIQYGRVRSYTIGYGLDSNKLIILPNVSTILV